MKRVMCIWIVDWPLARLASQRPELHGRTVLLYEASPQGGLKVVAAASALGGSLDRLAAERTGTADVIAGIYPGMPLAEAAAIVAHAQSVGNALRGVPEAPIDIARRSQMSGTAQRPFPTESLRQPHLEPADAQADRLALVQLAEWCQRFSPIVGIEDAPRPECLLLDVTGLAHLFGGERALAEEVTAGLVDRGFDARVAIADTIGAAWAIVHNDFAVAHPPAKPGADGALAVLAPLPIGYLRVADETVALLGTLGIYRVGQLAALPRSALLARFGPELLWRLDQATGQAPETILARHLPAEYAADFTFEAPIASREAIEHVLGQLITRVTEPLARRREGVLRLACRLKYEQAWEGDYRPGEPIQGAPHVPVLRTSTSAPDCFTLPSRAGLLPVGPPGLGQSIDSFAFSLGLFRPSASADYLRDLLRLRLESVRLAGPVASVHVEVTAIGPLELRQQDLFDGDDNREQPRRLAELVDRLSNRLGRGAVVQVALLPDAQPEYTCVDVPLAGGTASSVGNGLCAVPGVRMEPERHGGRSLQKAKRALKKRTKKNLAHVSRYGLLSFAPDERPLALLPQPARIEVLAVAPDGTPARFCWAGRRYSIAHAWGPERIETGWWRRVGQNGATKPRGHAFVRRDYYRVETTSGARFWIFRRLGDREWFLHGRFD